MTGIGAVAVKQRFAMISRIEQRRSSTTSLPARAPVFVTSTLTVSLLLPLSVAELNFRFFNANVV